VSRKNLKGWERKWTSLHGQVFPFQVFCHYTWKMISFENTLLWIRGCSNLQRKTLLWTSCLHYKVIQVIYCHGPSFLSIWTWVWYKFCNLSWGLKSTTQKYPSLMHWFWNLIRSVSSFQNFWIWSPCIQEVIGCWPIKQRVACSNTNWIPSTTKFSDL